MPGVAVPTPLLNVTLRKRDRDMDRVCRRLFGVQPRHIENPVHELGQDGPHLDARIAMHAKEREKPVSKRRDDPRSVRAPWVLRR